MELLRQEKIFDELIHRVQFQKTTIKWVTISSQLFLCTEQFSEYLDEMFQEFFAQLRDYASGEDFEYRRFKNFFEFTLQELNSKLSVFAQKVNNADFFDIRWVIECYYEHEYFASMIWEVWLVILRWWKVYYRLDNEINKRHKISLFSDFLEWDVHHSDQVVLVGNQLSQIIDDQDLEDIQDIVWIHDKTFLDLLADMATERSSYDFVKFAISTIVELRSKNFETVKETWKSAGKNFAWFISRYQSYILIGLFLIALVSVLFSLINSIQSQRRWITLQSWNSGALINFSVDDIKRQIANFQKMDPASPDKPALYTTISERLKLLEDQKKLPLDVAELKKILNEEYYKWFNIQLANSIDDYQKVYELTPADRGIFGWAIRLVQWKWWAYHLFWPAAAVIWNVNEAIKWVLIKYGSSVSGWIAWCSNDLQSNWLFCWDNSWNIFNVTKAWVGWVKLAWQPTKFPAPIVDVWVFGKTNLYVLTNHPEENKNWTFVIRYPATPWATSDFRNALPYSISGLQNQYVHWFSSMSIDWTFLLRSPDKKWIVQMWRDGTTTRTRDVPMKWGEWLWEQYGTGMKIFTFATSKYIYLYNPVSQTLTIYISNPLKTNDANKSTYSLTYVMRVVYDKSKLPIDDLMIMMNGSEPIVMMVTENWVFKYSLSETLSTFSQEQQ